MRTHSPIVNYVLIVSLFFLLPFHARAFDYIISFTGSGAATVIDSIRVMNLTAGTSELVPADYHLHLYNISTHTDLLNEKKSRNRNFNSKNENTCFRFNFRKGFLLLRFPDCPVRRRYELSVLQLSVRMQKLITGVFPPQNSKRKLQHPKLPCFTLRATEYFTKLIPEISAP